MRTVLAVAFVATAVAWGVPGGSNTGHVGGAFLKAEKKQPQRLRERFREEKEAAGRGDVSSEAIGERDAFEAWFMDQRAYPGDAVPQGAISAAFDFARRHNDDADEVDAKWRAIGPATIPDGQTDDTAGPTLSPVSGRVSAIAADPYHVSTVYVGGAQGGVWVTDNVDAAVPIWSPIADKAPSMAIGAIAVDPFSTNTIYVGTGEPNRSCDSYYGRGVMRTLNRGRSWRVFGGGGDVFNNPAPFQGKAVSDLIIDRATWGRRRNQRLWASTTLGFYTSGTSADCNTPSGGNIGLWRSNDSGETWELQAVPTTGVGLFSVHDVAQNLDNAEVLYVAVRSDGIWKSTNASTGSPATFTKMANGFPTGSAATPLRRIQMSNGGFGAGDTLYVAIENGAGSRLFGLYKTTDGGNNWSHVDAGFNGTATVTQGSTLVTRVSGPSFVAGNTWIGRRFVVDGAFSLTVASVIDGNRLRLTGAYPGATSAAANWSTGNYPTYCDGQCFYDMTVGVDPFDATGNTVYVGGNPRAFAPDLSGVPGRHSLWRTDDGGLSWRSVSQGDGISGGIHVDDHVITWGGDGTLYNGNDGGIWKSKNKGASWTALNTNLSITQFQGVSTHPFDRKIVLGGTQDNGTNILNAALQPPPKWFHADFGDGGQSLIDQSSPNTMYHTYFNQAFNFMGPAKSTIGGAGGPGSWDFTGCYFGYGPQYYNGMNPTDPVSFYAPLAQHPAFSPNVVYFGSNKIYRSPNPLGVLGPDPNDPTDNPVSWTAVSPVLTKAIGARNYVSWIGVLPSLVDGKEVLYSGSSDGRVAASANVDGSGVATWSIIDAAPLPNRAVTGIHVMENDASGNTAIVTFSGFNGLTPTTPGHVFITRNGLSGAPTWTDISGNLPDVPANAVAVDYSKRSRPIYVATDLGVFRSKDGGATWKHLSKGLPFVSVFGLERNRTTGQIVAATHGRGMFELVQED